MQNLNLWTQNNSLKLWLILSPVLGYHKGLTEGLKPGTLLLWNSVAKPSLLRFGLLSSISQNDGGWEGPLEVPLWLLQSFSVPHLPQCLAQTQRLTAASLMAPHLLVSDTILQSTEICKGVQTLWWKQSFDVRCKGKQTRGDHVSSPAEMSMMLTYLLMLMIWFQMAQN